MFGLKFVFINLIVEIDKVIVWKSLILWGKVLSIFKNKNGVKYWFVVIRVLVVVVVVEEEL